MAVINVREIWEGAGSSVDQRLKRDYRRVFAVTTNSMLDGSATIRSAIPVVPFEIYTDPNGVPDPLGAYANRIEDRRTEDPFEWIVVVSFSNRTDSPQLGVPSPTQRVAEVEWAWEQFQKPIERDALGDAIINSCGEKFDPVPQVDDSRLVLRIKRTEASFSPVFALAYKDVTNSDIFLGLFQPGQAKCRPIVSSRHFENGIYYFDVGYTIHFAEDWLLPLLDCGYRFIDDKGVHNFEDFLGRSLTGPALLNGEGLPLNGKGAEVPVTTLAADVDAQAQQITLTSAQWLPKLAATLPYLIQVDGEIMRVETGAGSTTPGVSRHASNTDAAQHTAGAPVTMLAYYLVFQPYKKIPFAPLLITP